MTAGAAGAGGELCGGCRDRGSCRMGVRSWDADPAAGTVLCRVVCSASDRAGPAIAHGGWTAGVFDDVLGRLPRAMGESAVTGSLQVRYVAPVPVERELLLSGWLVERERRRRTVSGELRLASTGALLASASAVMVVVDAGHAERHVAWLAEQDGSPCSAREEQQ
ncbi:MAG: PaaI family thioesterase [Frankiales bacterium]|nr:PaaI family thioesterase [Frankiales bacterium]